MTHVLVVDDELSIRETFQAFLEEAGYDVTTAADFFEAEPFLTHPSSPTAGGHGDVDIVVTDIILPHMDGLALLQRVRQVAEDVPVIMITGEPDLSTATEAVRHGAYDYIAKPVTQEVLNRVVGRAAERKRLLDTKRRLEAENRAHQAELEQKVADRTAELEQRHRELATLIEIGRNIPATLDLTEVLRRVTQRTAQVCGAHRCSILLLAEDGETLLPLMSQFSDGSVDQEMWRLFQDVGYPTSVSHVPEAQQAIHEQRPLFIPDASASSLPRHWIEPFGVKSVLVAPLIIKEQVIGLMALDHVDEGWEFTARQVDLAMAIAAQAAIAIENARLYETERRRASQMAMLFKAGQQLTQSLELERTLTLVAKQACQLLNTNHCGLLLYDEVTGEICHTACWGSSTSKALTSARASLSRSQTISQAVATHRPVVIKDAGSDPRMPREIVESFDIKSSLILPLVIGDRVLGLLFLDEDRAARHFTPEDIALATNLAGHAALAIENARLFEETDRRLGETRLLQEVMQAAASTLDFDEVLTRTIETLRRTLDIAHLTFALPDEQGTSLLLHPSRIGYASVPAGLRMPLDKSVSGRVYQTGEPQVIPDVRQVPYYFEGVPEVRSELTVPVKVAGRVIAVLDAESPDPGAFGEEDLRLFSAIAAQLGVTLENARLYQEMAQRTRDLRLLADASRGMIGSLEPQQIVDHLLAALVERFQAACGISLVDPDEQKITLAASWTPDGQPFAIPIDHQRHISEQSGLGQVIESRRSAYIPDIEHSAWWTLMSEQERRSIRQHGIKAALILPMLSRERVVGIASLRFREPLPEPVGDQQDWAQTMVNQAAAALVSAQLYQRLETQTAELSRAYGELQEINRLRTELVQNVRHELRTPLSLVKGYVELLLAGDLGEVPDNQRKALQVIQTRAATLERLIHNLTMLRTVPQQVLAVDRVSVVEVMRQAMAEFWGQAEKAGITFQEDLPAGLPLVLGDRQCLELVFGHLLDNAIKFSPDGGTVTIRAWADQKMVRLSITDEGIGIPSQHLSRIFERFYQVNGTTTRRFGGMGVGLALVFEIVEAHGGTVTVESSPGKGSTFTVVLPQIGKGEVIQ